MLCPFSVVVILATSLTFVTRACSDTGGTAVSYFDSGYTRENVNGSALVIDESSNHVFVVSSYPAVLKFNLQGSIVAGRGFSTTIWMYSISLSSDNAKIVTVGGISKSVLAVLSINDLSVLSLR